MNNSDLERIHGISILQTLFSELQFNWLAIVLKMSIIYNERDEPITTKNNDIMVKYLEISRIRTPHQHCQQECSCGFKLRSSYSLGPSLAHASSAEGSGEQHVYHSVHKPL